jgi:hypothetical protein
MLNLSTKIGWILQFQEDDTDSVPHPCTDSKGEEHLIPGMIFTCVATAYISNVFYY